MTSEDEGMVMQPLLLTMPQVAQLCQVGLDRVREWSNEPGFPVIRTPNQVRVHARLLDQWLADRALHNQEEAAA